MIDVSMSRRTMLAGAAALAAGAGAVALAGRAHGAAPAPTLPTLPARVFPVPVPHLIEVEQLVDYVTLLTPTATHNIYKQADEDTDLRWGTPGTPDDWRAIAQCSSFLVGVLRRTYRWVDDAYLQQHFGAVKPTARRLYDAFATAAQPPGFERVGTVVSLRPGDLIAIDYRNGQPTNTGHAAMVREVIGTYDRKVNLPGTVQYAVQIVDCTSDPHGVLGVGDYAAYPDTRLAPGVEQHGIGYGHMMFYADAVTGAFEGYRWSVNTSSDGTYRVAERPIAAARVV